MTDKEFRKLRRSALIEIIYEYQRRELEMNNEIAEKIKGMLVERLRIPADELEYDSELFGEEIGKELVGEEVAYRRVVGLNPVRMVRKAGARTHLHVLASGGLVPSDESEAVLLRQHHRVDAAVEQKQRNFQGREIAGPVDRHLGARPPSVGRLA